jgi:creatinine amidohydrolase
VSTPRLADMTSDEVAALVERPKPVALVPVGSVEPHGPHLPLATDTILSERAAERAGELLAARGIDAAIAPALPYGVTRYAAGFKGAVGVDEDALVAILRAVCRGLLGEGFARVCLVNNHLEPAHDAAIRKAASALAGRVVVACPLTRRWARTLSDEFKRGNCHAGRYETSLALAAGVPVRDAYRSLAPIATSLSEGIRSGKKTFVEMGLDRAYTGAPAEATREEGEALYEKLAEMIAGEVEESFAGAEP